MESISVAFFKSGHHNTNKQLFKSVFYSLSFISTSVDEATQTKEKVTCLIAW